MKYKNILVIGGTHGNELTGVRLVRYLQKHSLNNITPVMANKRAVIKKVRFIETDLNRSVGKLTPISYEEKLAQRLGIVIKKSDLVIEFHNTTSLNNSCAIVTTKPTKLHYNLAQHFGLNRILIMPAKGSLSGCNSKKFFSLEISNSDRRLTDIKRLFNKLAKINDNHSPAFNKIKTYKFSGIKFDKKTLKTLNVSLASLKNFKTFSKPISKSLDLQKNKKFCPIFIGEKAYGKDFGCQVVEELNFV